MKCKKINVKLMIGLLVLLVVIVITLNYRKINEKFNTFRDDSYIKNKIKKHNKENLKKQQQQQQQEQEQKQQENINSMKNTIYDLNQRVLIVEQLLNNIT